MRLTEILVYFRFTLPFDDKNQNTIAILGCDRLRYFKSAEGQQDIFILLANNNVRGVAVAGQHRTAAYKQVNECSFIGCA
jgi:hypothetical protein